MNNTTHTTIKDYQRESQSFAQLASTCPNGSYKIALVECRRIKLPASTSLNLSSATTFPL